MITKKDLKEEDRLGDPLYTSVDWDALLKAYGNTCNVSIPMDAWKVLVDSQLESIRKIALSELPGSSDSKQETIDKFHKITVSILDNMWRYRAEL